MEYGANLLGVHVIGRATVPGRDVKGEKRESCHLVSLVPLTNPNCTVRRELYPASTAPSPLIKHRFDRIFSLRVPAAVPADSLYNYRASSTRQPYPLALLRTGSFSTVGNFSYTPNTLILLYDYGYVLQKVLFFFSAFT